MPRIFPQRRITWLFFIGLLSIFGITVILYSTVWGAGLSDDSYYYIHSVRDWLSGQGFTLTPHFPPVLPILLTGVGLSKIDPLVSIRWTNAMVFGLNIFLCGWISLLITDSFVFSGLGAMLFSISISLIDVHSMAMSEPLFLTFTYLGILACLLARSHSTKRQSFLMGLFFGLAAATRYIGVALLLAGGLFWLTEAGKSVKQRLQNATIFSLTAIIPLLIWSIRNELLIGRPTSRVFAWHIMPMERWWEAFHNILLWLIPGRFVNGEEKYWLGLIVFAGILWLGWQMLKNPTGLRERAGSLLHSPGLRLLFLILLFYWTVLVISRSFFDERIPTDSRLLSPVLAMALPIFVYFLHRLWSAGAWYQRSLVVLLCGLFIITNSTRSYQTVPSYHEIGRGYASARDHISEIYAYLRNRPEIPVYSNAAAAIYFWTGRDTYSIPGSDGITGMREDMKRRGALLVIFDSISLDLYGTSQEELTKGLDVQIQLSEGTIYRYPN